MSYMGELKLWWQLFCNIWKYQINWFYTLNLLNAICPSFLSKADTGKNKPFLQELLVLLRGKWRNQDSCSRCYPCYDCNFSSLVHIFISPPGFTGGSDNKQSACNEGNGFDSWVGKIPWRREQLTTLVFWPGEFHGQKSLADYSPWGRKEVDTTEQLTHTYTNSLEQFLRAI